jgi:eukaryotic-like serine/threonine-protein kinase
MPRLPCLDEDTITDLIAGRCGLDAGALEQHLEECAACLRLLGAARATFDASPAPPRPRGALTCGTVLKQTYAVLRLVGCGGMGEVYEVSHVRLSGRYAIKVLRADISQDQELLSRFRREAEITSALRHPNIVQVIDFDRTPAGCAYLAMEFLEGCDLTTLLRRDRALPLPRAMALVGQVVSALSAAHKRGIVHRDLTPGNIFVVPEEVAGEERVKLMDFGLSKRIDGPLGTSSNLSRDRAIIGTPRYMAPEQALGRSHEVTAATDQFALAAVVYEMLAGTPAFAGENLVQLLHAIAYQQPASLRRQRGDVPASVVSAVHRALAKAPGDRFAGVQDFHRALLGQGATPAVGSSGRRRRHAPGLLIVAAIAVAAVGAIWAARSPRAVPGQASIGVAPVPPPLMARPETPSLTQAPPGRVRAPPPPRPRKRVVPKARPAVTVPEPTEDVSSPAQPEATPKPPPDAGPRPPPRLDLIEKL